MIAPAAAHGFVADLDIPIVDDRDAHHLSRVLRLRPGEEITASDGAGRWRLCRYNGTQALEPTGPVVTEPRPSPPITIAFAPVKGDRSEWTVQKLTELGVDRIIPMRTARSVVRWDIELPVARRPNRGTPLRPAHNHAL